MHRLRPFVLAALLSQGGCAAVDHPSIVGQVNQEDLFSPLVDDTYLIQVRLPPDYAASPTRSYPVAYQLDGTSFGPEFDVTAGFASQLEQQQRIPETIVVGIGYPYPDPLAGGVQGRSRDYVTVQDDGQPGGGANFLRFLEEQLIPHIDAEYRTDPARRLLLGHSLGGFFALHTMLTTGADPSPPFQGFVGGDPTSTENDDQLFTEEATLAARTGALPAALYLDYARYDGAEQQLYVRALSQRLSRDFPGLRLSTHEYDTDHRRVGGAQLRRRPGLPARRRCAVRRAATAATAALLLLGGRRAEADEEVTTVVRAPWIGEGGETGRPVHVTLDATATYGIGAYSALGAQLHGVGYVPVWNTGYATGSLDFGALLGVQDEPQLFQYAVPEGLSNDARRINAWLTVGHSFHLGLLRRVRFGVHLFGGWTHVFTTATANDPVHGIHMSVSDNYGLPNVGGMLKLDYRFSRYLGLDVQAVGPFPVEPSYVTTLFHVGVGLTAYLR